MHRQVLGGDSDYITPTSIAQVFIDTCRDRFCYVENPWLKRKSLKPLKSAKKFLSQKKESRKEENQKIK